VEITTSQYAVGETSRNLESHEHRRGFEELLGRTRFVSDADVRVIPGEIELVVKDQPILAAAIAGSMNYLITGDRRHFGALYNRTVAGVRVMAPGDFLRLYKDRLA
jgi:predicted nucleic acid-binding protein